VFAKIQKAAIAMQFVLSMSPNWNCRSYRWKISEMKIWVRERTRTVATAKEID